MGQAELVIIDEAAAIPLPLVRNLLGPYLVFMASTINGYEGTGRSLSLKLIQQLRESTRPSFAKDATAQESSATTTSSSKKVVSGNSNAPKTRTLREIKLETPIRYGAGDRRETPAIACASNPRGDAGAGSRARSHARRPMRGSRLQPAPSHRGRAR